MSNQNQHREEVTVSAGDSSDPIFFPARTRDVSVKVIPGAGGNAAVDFTLDNPDAVRADPDNAEWEEWEPGDVTVATSRALVGAVTAVRARATTEAAVFQVVTAIDF